MKLLQRLFPCYEVSITLDAARSIFNELNPACRPIIEPAVLKEIRNAEKTLYSIRIEHMKPDHLALILTTNVLGRHLSSGLHHIYRSRLNLIGEDMLELWNDVQTRMVNSSYITVVERDEDDRWVREQISKVG